MQSKYRFTWVQYKSETAENYTIRMADDPRSPWVALVQWNPPTSVKRLNQETRKFESHETGGKWVAFTQILSRTVIGTFDTAEAARVAVEESLTQQLDDLDNFVSFFRRRHR